MINHRWPGIVLLTIALVQGFWLTQCIFNWTGLITEMDKIEPPFYTDENWGGPDERNIWGNFIPSSNNIIEYYFVHNGET